MSGNANVEILRLTLLLETNIGCETLQLTSVKRSRYSAAMGQIPRSTERISSSKSSQDEWRASLEKKHMTTSIGLTLKYTTKI